MVGGTNFVFSIADDLLFERGEFDPIDFLVSVGLLDEDDHRAWQAGHRSDIQSALLCDLGEAIDALEQARTYLLKQGLTSMPPPASAGEIGAARIGTSSKFVELCSSRFVPSRMQRDMFQDSALTGAEHAIRGALGGHRLGAAQEALALFQKLGGPASASDAYQRLLDAAERDNPSAAERLVELEEILAPLSLRYLGEHARGYLAPLWQALGLRLDDARFIPTSPKLHSSYAHARAGEWRRVVEAVENEPNWQQHAALMTRLAEAYSRLSNRESARRIWTLLCWNHPDTATNVLGKAPGDPLLAKRWREFSDLDPELPVQEFPSWLLIADLRQREYVPASFAPETPARAAYAATHRLISNHEDIGARKALKEYNEDLLKHYLVRRRL